VNHRNKQLRVLPYGIRSLSDFYFYPTREERLLERLKEMKAEWDREDDARNRRRATQIAREVEADRRKQEREDSLDRIRNYFLQANQQEAPAMAKLLERMQEELEGPWRRKMLAKVEKIAEEIRRDKARAERKALLQRGVVRGRRE
jgi:hypothetical protein